MRVREFRVRLYAPADCGLGMGPSTVVSKKGSLHMETFFRNNPHTDMLYSEGVAVIE